MNINVYIDYDMIFTEKPLSVLDYLRHIDRQFLIGVSLRLIYSNDIFSIFKNYCEEFFCLDNTNFANECNLNLNEYLKNNKNDITSVIPRNYIITSQSTALELLRQTFAINIDDFIPNISQVLQEQYLFKAILLINKSISNWNTPLEHNSKGEITNLSFAKSLFCSTLNNYDYVNLKAEYVAMLQIIKGYHFFKYCEHSKIKEHLSVFIKNKGAQSWYHYFYNAIKLILFSLQNKQGEYPRIELDNLRNGENFLRAQSFKEDTIIPLEKNLDYTYFKSHPLIELNDGTYLPINPIFCINHIYKSIYFEFRTINDSFQGRDYYIKGQGLLNIFTTEFSEHTLFERYIRNSICNHRGIKISDRDCKKKKTLGHEPDFYLRDGNNIILFENKDIKIPDKTINNKQYNLLEKVLDEKLISTKGISQLVYHIKQIENKTFKWDSNLPNRPKIYPVIVIDDSSLCAPGLNYILNEALQQQLKSNNIKLKVKPLVLIELDTLIIFENYFKLHNVKLKKLLDEYYKYISNIKKSSNIEELTSQVLQMYIPFYIFISKEIVKSPFDNRIFKNILIELQEATKTH